MNSPLKDFFEQERKRVFAPGPYFSKRVIAQLSRLNALNELNELNELNVKRAESGIWDVVPSSARPVFALALSLFLGFLAFQAFVPELPTRGIVEAYLDADQVPGESLLYSEAEVPDGQQLFLEMMGVGEE